MNDVGWWDLSEDLGTSHIYENCLENCMFIQFFISYWPWRKFKRECSNYGRGHWAGTFYVIHSWTLNNATKLQILDRMPLMDFESVTKSIQKPKCPEFGSYRNHFQVPHVASKFEFEKCLSKSFCIQTMEEGRTGGV